MKNDRPLGIREIAIELGQCERTIRRWHKDRKIPTYQLGGKTSPIKMSRTDMKLLKKRRSK